MANRTPKQNSKEKISRTGKPEKSGEEWTVSTGLGESASSTA
jgi:hypothetical protein